MRATDRAYRLGYIGVSILLIIAFIRNWGW